MGGSNRESVGLRRQLWKVQAVGGVCDIVEGNYGRREQSPLSLTERSLFIRFDAEWGRRVTNIQ